MADLSTQFHARTSEIASFVEAEVRKWNLYSYGVTFPPWKISHINRENIRPAILSSVFRQIVLSTSSVELNVKGQTDFAEKYPGLLYFDIGYETPVGLQQSRLSCRTEVPAIPKVWKEIVRSFKTITDVGAIAFNPKTGALARVRDHRFTKGAKQLCDDGTPILPMAGIVRLKLGTMVD